MIDCSDIVLYIDEKSSASRRIVNFLERAGCRGYKIYHYKNYEDEIATIEGGSFLVPLLWNRKTNKIIVGCPIEYEKFVEKLLRLIESKEEFI